MDSRSTLQAEPQLETLALTIDGLKPQDVSLTVLARFAPYFVNYLSSISDQIVHMRPYRPMTTRSPHEPKIVATRTGQSFELLFNYGGYFQHFVLTISGVMKEFWDMLRNTTNQYSQDNQVQCMFRTTLYFGDPRDEQHASAIRSLLLSRPVNHQILQALVPIILSTHEDELTDAARCWNNFREQVEQGRIILPALHREPVKENAANHSAEERAEINRLKQENERLAQENIRLRTQPATKPLSMTKKPLIAIEQLPTNPTVLTTILAGLLLNLSEFSAKQERTLSTTLSEAWDRVSSLTPPPEELPEILREQVTNLRSVLQTPTGADYQIIYQSLDSLLQRLAEIETNLRQLPSAEAEVRAIEDSCTDLAWLKKQLADYSRLLMLGRPATPEQITETLVPEEALISKSPAPNGKTHGPDSESSTAPVAEVTSESPPTRKRRKKP